MAISAPTLGGRLLEPPLVRIPEGWFTMGSDAGRDDERPAHRVWVDAFCLAAFQVRNAEYAEFLRVTGVSPPTLWHDPHFSHPDQPVVSVSWFDAGAYCQWLTGVTGRRYRLPTEAEWERAARGSVDGQLFPWGDEPPESRPEYHARWKTGPEPVGRFAPNAFGLYDICENVHEWCSDWYRADYYRVSPERNPQGPVEGSRRASRGGSWRHHIRIARCSARSSIPPDYQYADYGFRVASDADVC
ncbi:MAG TPA: formylglycine-generating enzyme family protein [Terriglobales bacterium]|jgi:formylglycine-generating enzyme required for sulfatase activity|nr:formylglycine-generating enzyme family protein [Terriglobales bacterium]